ncbi:eukaryotic translation initiation factor 4 gamma 1-like isoform X3 [Tribolium madens]|uniref:eukaryotic translation initiation factor 4 gamma 1-like isoform X3 n=1 Tax=Tribolium madens TaxID=41895 RepID=UPI001CF730CB|nr:eukaryotic translation initiation factor 4 gamma 1-like isoform X3 [Tribolium madens]
MSGNQKQAAGRGPQNQAYSATLYQPIGQQPRTDGFHVPTQPYVPQQQPNQPGNQAQTLRGIAPTGPPNQASTPPNNDINKVQSVPPQQSMSHMYVTPQQPVRGTQGTYYRSGPPSQQARMPAQHRNQQQIYQTPAATQYVPMPVPPVYINAMPYYNGQRPQAFVPQTPLLYQGGQHLPSQFTFQPNPNQPSVPFPFYSIRQNHPSQTATVPPNSNQPIQTINITQTQPTFQTRQNKRRAKAIPVIDPDTGVDRLDEVYEQNNSHPPSGESSARQTPQPVNNVNKEIQATFAKQVLQVANSEPSLDDQEIHSSSLDHETLYPGTGQTSKLDHLVQSSNLKVQAPEFVLSPSNTAKETPIVSAICDAVEVTLPNKQMKDRESPAKGRKQKEQQQHKDSVKDTPIREKVSDKESSNVNKSDNKSKETLLPSASIAPTVSTTPVTVTNKDNKEVVTTLHRDDKKNQKKDTKNDTNVPNVDVNESANVSTNQPAQPAQDVSTSAKSKNASQRTKDGQKQQQISASSNQKQAAAAAVAGAVVPAPQPSKPNSKSSKKNELNQKGANKEGTDMDAFNDNVQLDDVNANVSINNEINANSVVNNTNNTTVPTSDANKKNHNTETSTFRTETKTLPKSKVDITDIVKEKPKPIKSFPQPTETQDEIDRATPLNNDKLVQAKNEANTKASSENSTGTIIEPKPALPYRDGQWAPDNLDGKKVYDKDFLMALRHDPASRRKPENIPDVIVADERGRLSDGRYSIGGGRTDFAPSFNYGGKSGSQRGPPPKRNSQSGKVGGGGGKGSKSQMIKVSISVREDVKLHEVENAWKPARFHKSENMSDEERKTEELYRKVRGVLNRLTPQKFDTLVSQVRQLQIDTAERLQGVIDLVFEKAVDEPNFSVAYALMCRELALMQVPATNSSDDKKEFVNFRKLLVTRCQIEFEKQSLDENARPQKLKEIEDCTDPEKKKELTFDLEEYDRRLRMKSVGNIRFIGELFKQQMLTVNIMLRCLDNLLENGDEESLECLCKLLTTIGKELESKEIDLNKIFNAMKDIVDKKQGKVSSRVRFMLQDVIDLRRSKWIPRRQDSNPKTIDQIQKEAENEHLNIQAMNSVPVTPRKDDRGSSAGANTERKRRNVSSDDGWQTTTRNRTQFSVQSDKLKNKPPQTDEPLGSRQMFGNWSKGSNIKTETSATTNTANMYAALEHIDTEKRPSGSRSKDPYSSKGPSLERYNKSYNDGRGSRSGSQHRSAERESSLPPAQKLPQTTMPTTPKAAAQVPNMTEEQLERHMKNNLDEYLNDSCSIEEYSQDTQATVPQAYFPKLVTDGYQHVLERSSTARLRTGKLFADLINSGTLPLEDYCKGLENLLSEVDDLTIDIPMIWNYLGEILVHLICEEALSINRLHKSCELIIEQGHGAKLLGALFKLVVSEKGPNFLTSCWQASGLSLESFMNQSQVESFIKDNKLDFLCGGAPATVQNQLTYEQIHNKLREFYAKKIPFDDIVNWITANAGDRVKDGKFVRILATSIFDHAIVRHRLVVENLKANYKLLQKYVDNKPEYELQCLYALQALIQKLEHPKGLLLTICNQLYEDAIISQDSFIAWEASTDPAEKDGKGVALMQLTSFFTQLKENEEESGSSSDET